MRPKELQTHHVNLIQLYPGTEVPVESMPPVSKRTGIFIPENSLNNKNT
jgi:hypothetical protein